MSEVNGTATDPVSWASAAAKSLFDMIRYSLRSEEDRKARFKERTNIRDARDKARMIKFSMKQIRKISKRPTVIQIEDTMNSLFAKMEYTELQDMICVVKERFGLNN